MSGFEGFYVGLAVAGCSVLAGFIAAAFAVAVAYAMRWLLAREDLFDYALAFIVGVVAALAVTGCSQEVVAKGPHWWNCMNVVCHQVASRVDEARYMRSTKSCECWIEDGRHMPQWIVIK